MTTIKRKHRERQAKGVNRYKLPVTRYASRGSIIYSTRNIDNNIVSTFIVTGGNKTYRGHHLIMHRNVESLRCAPKTNIVCQ